MKGQSRTAWLATVVFVTTAFLVQSLFSPSVNKLDAGGDSVVDADSGGVIFFHG